MLDLLDQVNANSLDRHKLEFWGDLDCDRCPDMEAARLGLCFTEMVLRVMPGGPEAVEAADGIDALEELQFRYYLNYKAYLQFLQAVPDTNDDICYVKYWKKVVVAVIVVTAD